MLSQTYNVTAAHSAWLPNPPQVPIRYYQYSEAAFFTAAVLNLIAFVFEETNEKRQLALLSALIKGLSWHCDYKIVTGSAIITLDGYGAL